LSTTQSLNEGGAIFLASELQMCNYGINIDSVSHQHKHPDGTPGMQAMYLLDGDNTIIPFIVQGALSMYRHTTPTHEELEALLKHHVAYSTWTMGPT